MQAYEAEFSELTQKLPDKCGKFAPDTFIDENHDGYIFFNEVDLPIGFCIKGVVDGIHDISEFYIIPALRKKGVGKIMAEMIFESYLGEWQVRQIMGADKAHAFWYKAISDFTNGQLSDSIIDDPHWGKVHRQKFVSKKAR
jgi:predicted acetyltransferase